MGWTVKGKCRGKFFLQKISGKSGDARGLERKGAARIRLKEGVENDNSRPSRGNRPLPEGTVSAWGSTALNGLDGERISKRRVRKFVEIQGALVRASGERRSTFSWRGKEVKRKRGLRRSGVTAFGRGGKSPWERGGAREVAFGDFQKKTPKQKKKTKQPKGKLCFSRDISQCKEKE